MRGGYRPGSGRPRKSPFVTAKDVRPEDAVPEEVPPPGGYTGVTWLMAVVNNERAAPERRDKAAAVLVGIEARRVQPPGKKLQAEQNAKLAGWQTHWWPLLNDTEAPDFDPDGLIPEDRAAWEAKRAKRQAEQPKRAEPEPTRRSWDELLGERERRLSGDLPETDWGDDLRYEGSHRFPPPVDDE